MKIITALLFFYVATGCSTIDYSQFPLSSASVNIIKAEKLTEDKISISFNYAVDEFVKSDGLYFCDIHYITEPDTVATFRSIYQTRCQIDINKGTSQTSSKLPIGVGKFKGLRKFQVVVAIHQKIGTTSSKIIGQSDVVVFENTI